ncbi:MAG: acetyl-CoA carboxylase biotin carboxylase subunit [Planctomycetota bacterium]|jgi:acetyl-CoA carboxylase biotin carboxylase subunit|nr:acetyl-CoA carboxylase biotin carboxylase subunit [Planctomycetota bacterium]
MFSRILIANRGEIAVRIIRACRKLGIEAVAVYSEVDRDSLHVKLADVAVCIGPAESARSYLHIPSIISAAQITDVEAIHPGFGFLSENSHFAETCQSLDIKFIGPTSKAMAKMGDKAMARKIAQQSGVPVLPGSQGVLENDDEGIKLARSIGYPVIVKARAGGGGRGIRIAHNEASLKTGMQQARAEAEAAFGDGSLYIEKFLEHPRHVEMQILADEHGNVLYLGERDCSIQRRHQKLLEESPSPVVDGRLRKQIGEAAVALCKQCAYTNAGTIEFLYEGGKFYFMEMNTRIQVEHPVTEMTTGLDLVEEQLRIAAGEKLQWTQNDIVPQGHAMEFRINAEDPDRNFAPFPGKIDIIAAPTGTDVRVDTFVYSGYRIPPNYDSMIAKLIVRGKNRAAAIQLGKQALSQFLLEGVKTTIPFHRKLLGNNNFVSNNYDINFIDENFL